MTVSVTKQNITNLMVDLGNANIKTNTGIVFSSRFSHGKPINPLGESVITFNGESYTMEHGYFDNKFNKAKKNFMPNLLYAIIRSSDVKQEDFNLMLNYPVDNAAVSSEFKELLSNKEFKVNYQKGSKSIDRTIRIHNVNLVPECVASYYTLNSNQRAEDLMIIDIGSRTTNVAVFTKRKLIEKFTIPLGSIDLFSTIMTRWNNDNGDNKQIEDIERLIDIGYITDTEVEEMQFLDDIMNQIDRRVDRKTYINYYTGGTSLRLQFLIENYVEPNGTLMDNPLFSNVNGSKVIFEAINKNV